MVVIRVLLPRFSFNQKFVKTQTLVRNYCDVKSDIKRNEAATSYQPITDFYAGKSVFVTGGTGFLGKVLVEKLLSSTKLEKIYLLIRDKKGVDVNTRLEYMFENPLFSKIKDKDPTILSKVVPITGDVNLPNLGLSYEKENTLKDKVSVVFHSAATVMFNEPLSVVMKTNFKGTQQVLNLTKRIKNVEAYVHISTAYTYPQRPVLLETVYPSPVDLKDVWKFMEEHGDNKKETTKFLNGYPSTYNFSKALTESYVANNHGNIPTVIIRPSMVSPKINEPLKGWTDNWFAATAMLHNAGKGWHVLIHGNKNNIIDLIPVDYVTNLAIISAARINGSKELQIYNSTSSSENPITYGESLKRFSEEFVKLKQNEVPWVFFVYSNSMRTVNLLCVLLQKIPAHIADYWLKIRGREPKYVSMISRVVSVRKGLDFYTSKSWVMRADKTRELYSKLSPEDQKQFPCDPTNIIWSQYLKDYCNGILKYLKPKFTARR